MIQRKLKLVFYIISKLVQRAKASQNSIHLYIRKEKIDGIMKVKFNANSIVNNTKLWPRPATMSTMYSLC